MAGLNSSSRDPDPDDQPLRHPDFERKVRVASTARGGGGGRGGEHVKCCYECGRPGHFARDCAKSGGQSRSYGRRGNQACGNGADAIEVYSGNENFKRKPPNMSTEFSVNPEQAKVFSGELPKNNVYISSLLADIAQKEKELKLYGQENEGLKNRLNEATSEISSLTAEKEKVISMMRLLAEDFEKCKNNLSSAKDKEAEVTHKWGLLKDELEDTKAQLNKKLQEVEKANEAAEVEMKELKLESEQWRKAAKAAAAVLVGGEEMCSKTAELESLVLYYSSRAAKRMSLGKMRKAIVDCRMAAQLDPNFLKPLLTAGNCHLVLGEVHDAIYNYKKYLDRRLAIEASDGLQNAQKVDNCVKQAAELLQQKTFESATSALEVIAEALSISFHSEKLLEMKGEALFMLRKYEKVVQMCEQNLAFAEKNFATICDGNHVSDGRKSPKFWRWSLTSRSYFHLGRLEMALTILEKQEQLISTEAKTPGSPIPLATTVRELLHSKSEGNKAYQAGRHKEALEHYSNALSRSIESRPFTAVCLCNRAAARQALGAVIDAIADCNLAIALDGTYLKAISRRANLHKKLRDYEHAALDLKRLVSLLEKQCGEESIASGKSSGGGAQELRVARRRLSDVERNMKKEIALDLYLILGLKASAAGSDIKKAYHKAALRHHPDKAGKFLARSKSGDEGQIWKDIVTAVQEDADRLFKMIGEAYAVLSDTNKRFMYNLEEAMADDSF